MKDIEYGNGYETVNKIIDEYQKVKSPALWKWTSLKAFVDEFEDEEFHNEESDLYDSFFDINEDA